MKHPIRPLGRNIVVRVPLLKPNVINGITMPTTEIKEPYAEIVAIGDDVTTVELGLKVVYKPHGQTEIHVDGGDYLILLDSDILAVMEDD
jgi:chaperonin GroES